MSIIFKILPKEKWKPTLVAMLPAWADERARMMLREAPGSETQVFLIHPDHRPHIVDRVKMEFVPW